MNVREECKMQVLWGILWFVLLIVGFLLLVKGADFFVDGAAGIAKKLHVSSFIIGLTIVALGTSAPEAAVSVIGGIKTSMGQPDGAEVIMGNVLGSNMINILLILGVCSLVTRIPVEKSSRCIEIPFLIVVSIIFILLGDIGGGYTWYDGLILIALYAAFTAYTIIMAKRNGPVMLDEENSVSATAAEEAPVRSGFFGFMDRCKAKYAQLSEKTWFLIVITVVGLGMVVGGAQLVVDNATSIAKELFGLPTNIIALTVVAFGTSLPELVTSLTAAKKGDMGLATGNIIGSNIANVLLIAGLGFVSCGGSVVAFDCNALLDGHMSVIAAFVLLIFSFSKDNKLGKTAGIVMLVSIACYFVYRILAAYGVLPLLQIPAIFTKL